jgi:hypothetical protein
MCQPNGGGISRHKKGLLAMIATDVENQNKKTHPQAN